MKHDFGINNTVSQRIFMGLWKQDGSWCPKVLLKHYLAVTSQCNFTIYFTICTTLTCMMCVIIWRFGKIKLVPCTIN